MPHLFAVGDITGPPLLAHRATHQGKVAAEVAAGRKAAFEASVIPSVAYTDPEIAWVGVTETEAKAEGRAIEKATFPWAASGRAIGTGRDEGLTKLVFDAETRRLVGAGIVGPHAGELISEAVLAIEMGADPEDIALSIHPIPPSPRPSTSRPKWSPAPSPTSTSPDASSLPLPTRYGGRGARFVLPDVAPRRRYSRNHPRPAVPGARVTTRLNSSSRSVRSNPRPNSVGAALVLVESHSWLVRRSPPLPCRPFAELRMTDVNKVVLAYSGGLDTSIILRWLKENYGCEVVTFTADLGQGEELGPARRKAKLLGASAIFVDDLREEFARDFIFPMFRANAVYEGEYLLGTSIARPLIAKRLVEIADETGADAIAHGATGKGNDQVRFELGAYALRPRDPRSSPRGESGTSGRGKASSPTPRSTGSPSSARAATSPPTRWTRTSCTPPSRGTSSRIPGWSPPKRCGG